MGNVLSAFRRYINSHDEDGYSVAMAFLDEINRSGVIGRNEDWQ